MAALHKNIAAKQPIVETNARYNEFRTPYLLDTMRTHPAISLIPLFMSDAVRILA
jgi:hypothetical protein